MTDSYQIVPPSTPTPETLPVPPPVVPAPVPTPPTRIWPTILSTAVLVLTIVHGTLVWRIVHVVPTPAPIPSPVVPTPKPTPPVIPTPVVPTPVTPVPATTAKLHVSLVFDPHADAHAVAPITSDSTLAATLKGMNAEWYLIDKDEAHSINIDTKFGSKKTPLIAVQVEGDESHPYIYPLPANSSGVVAIVKQLRGNP
jgi:hypothetical protein